jgi:hypothetical protein
MCNYTLITHSLCNCRSKHVSSV